MDSKIGDFLLISWVLLIWVWAFGCGNLVALVLVLSLGGWVFSVGSWVFSFSRAVCVCESV